MKRIPPPLLQGLLLVLIVWVWTKTPLTAQTPEPTARPTSLAVGQALPPTPFFRYPVVANAIVSSYFDHDPAARSITFFDGRTSEPGDGFLFACPAVGGAWVGCENDVAGEPRCANERELWYDNHRGIDFEYVPDWHTGASCNLDKFGRVTIIVYAPAAGLVDYVGEDDPYNGNYIRLYHDLDGDGNYYNDGLRSYYLHFADGGILVDEGERVEAGDQLGYGGATGLAWTPHLHFEVQQRTAVGWASVDPFGWLGPEEDPWYAPNHLLWQEPAATPNTPATDD